MVIRMRRNCWRKVRRVQFLCLVVIISSFSVDAEEKAFRDAAIFNEKMDVRLSLEPGSAYKTPVPEGDILNNQISNTREDFVAFLAKQGSFNLNVFPYSIFASDQERNPETYRFLRGLGIHFAYVAGLTARQILYPSNEECERVSGNCRGSNTGRLLRRFGYRIGLRWDILLWRTAENSFINIVPGFGFLHETGTVDSKTYPLFPSPAFQLSNQEINSFYASLSFDRYFYFSENWNFSISVGIMYANSSIDFGSRGLETVGHQFYFPISIGIGFR